MDKNIVGISYDNNNRLSYFLTNDLTLKKDSNVIVETEKGQQYGKVKTEVIKLADNTKLSDLNEVVRLATKKDYQKHKKNLEDAEKALQKCKSISKKMNIKMQVLDATYTFNREQLLFRFLADTRIDFRDLAKKLASIYKTRIELRQIGVRDKAREIGGIGVCGQVLCCSRFMNTFAPVSINMAKDQNLSLNPNKINGSCGRLLCCLKYEDECYKRCQKGLPKIGDTVKIKEGTGVVKEVNVLKRKYYVDIPQIGLIEVIDDSIK